MFNVPSSEPSQENEIDATYCNYLLARYEKNRAIENDAFVDCLVTPEYLHYLATYGNHEMENYVNILERQELDLQLKIDKKMLECTNKANSAKLFETLHGFLTQKIFFDNVNASKAENELDEYIKQVKSENECIQEEIQKLMA